MNLFLRYVRLPLLTNDGFLCIIVTFSHDYFILSYRVAPVMKSAYTLDLGCVTTVHLFPASSGQVNFKSKTKYAPVVKSAYTLDFGCVTTVHLFPASSGRLISRAKIEYASMAELADAPDFGCVTTVHLFPASSGQVNFKSKN